MEKFSPMNDLVGKLAAAESAIQSWKDRYYNLLDQTPLNQSAIDRLNQLQEELIRLSDAHDEWRHRALKYKTLLLQESDKK